MTNMTYLHTVTVGRLDAITPLVLVVGGELVQLAGDVVRAARVGVPVGVDAVGGNVSTLLGRAITIILGGVILVAPLAVASRLAVDLGDLALHVNVGCWNATMLATTSLSITAVITDCV
jgi:hypothetical protein